MCGYRSILVELIYFMELLGSAVITNVTAVEGSRGALLTVVLYEFWWLCSILVIYQQQLDRFSLKSIFFNLLGYRYRGISRLW